MVEISNLPSVTPPCLHFYALRGVLLFDMGNVKIQMGHLNPCSVFVFRVTATQTRALASNFTTLNMWIFHVFYLLTTRANGCKQIGCTGTTYNNVGCSRCSYRGRQKMPTLYLFAIRFSFRLSPLAYRYMGNNYTNGTNNVPGADINCSIFLFSLLKMKSLGFC